jgi:GNAT superfamily N-acetyltransferase
MSVARVHVRSWQVGYRHLLPAEYLAALAPEDRAKRYTFGSSDPNQPSTIVAVEHDAICGFATTLPAGREDLPGCGLLGALYVDPDHWSRGIGRALLHAARARLVKLGCDQAILWVLAGNTRAQRFYEQNGWVSDGQQRQEVVWGIAVEDVRYRCRL